LLNKKKKRRPKPILFQIPPKSIDDRNKQMYVNASINELEWLDEMEAIPDSEQVHLIVELPKQVYEYVLKNEEEWTRSFHNSLRSALQPVIDPESIQAMKYHLQFGRSNGEIK